jgi:hypothetical protein
MAKKDLKNKKESNEQPQVPSRQKEYKDHEDLEDVLVKLYNDVEAGFDAQSSRSDRIADYWDCYNNVLNHSQFYTGNSQIYVPIITDAIGARVTRFTNQIFPQSGRYVDVVTEDGKIPHATMSLLEYYIRKLKLVTDVVPALIRSGDIEGQYTISLSWEQMKRDVVYRVPKAPEIQSNPTVVDPTETVFDIEEEELVDSLPHAEIISDCDLLVLPATAASIDDALNCGGSCTVIRRWSKSKIKQMIADKQISKRAGDQLIFAMSQKQQPGRKNIDKQMLDAAGIKQDGSGQKVAWVYETWTKLTVDDKTRLFRIFYAGVDKILSAKRNPYWSDRCPIISCPVEKVKGSFKGKSKVEPVASFQYGANDAVNMGMDSAAYSLLPIVMTDPEKNPRVGSMVLSLAAIWETSPQDTQFAKFPNIWTEAFDIVNTARAQIFQSLSVNSSQIPQTQTSKKRMNQAEIANEQQIDVLTTADAVTRIEGGILTPMLHFILEMDHQFRDKAMTIMQHGEMGVKASMQEVDPISMNIMHYIKWFGVEASRSAQQVQQQIAAMNVLRGIPPQQYEGYKLDLTPLITHLVENAFGPRLAPLIFKDMAKQYSIPPELENELLLKGIDMPISPFDNVQQHIQAHQQALMETGDPYGTIRQHIQAHQTAIAMMMQQQAMQQGGMPGAPGGAGPGMPGAPKPGAQPGIPRQQGPNGMIHQDQMQDPSRMPQ